MVFTERQKEIVTRTAKFFIEQPSALLLGGNQIADYIYVLGASRINTEIVWRKYKKKVEEMERKERKRLKNKKKSDRMKRLRVKKEKKRA